MPGKQFFVKNKNMVFSPWPCVSIPFFKTARPDWIQLDNAPMLPTLEVYSLTTPEDRRIRLLALHDLILLHFPTAKIDMAFPLPTYHLDDASRSLDNRKH